ncbi:hypothetical protein HPB48_021202 [Haemaphysalis longicornis]|uniref:Uncharacterized protein n=1 Tax=Haemaphysalis longicornis TaxID=44386 RepID=A0A9J6G876_HAELO|nr:hypothetical protein HPB48_021202 [Haemaphysalis longicornis]
MILQNNNVVSVQQISSNWKQIDDGKPNRGLSLGNLFSTGGVSRLHRSHSSPRLLNVRQNTRGGMRGLWHLRHDRSPTALLEIAGRCSGADKKRRQGEDDECCEPAFLVGWNWPAIRGVLVALRVLPCGRALRRRGCPPVETYTMRPRTLVVAGGGHVRSVRGGFIC